MWPDKGMESCHPSCYMCLEGDWKETSMMPQTALATTLSHHPEMCQSFYLAFD